MKKDSLSYVESDYYLKMHRIQRGVAKLGSISPQTVSKIILKEYTTEDFEHPYYRMFMLLTTVFTFDVDTEYIRKTLKITEQAYPVYNSENTLEIRLKDNHEVLVNGEKYPIDDFKKVFFATYDKIGSETEINLYVSPMSPYGDFALIQSVIESYMYDVRNKEAQHSFNKVYEELRNSQKQQVIDAHPLHMIEIPNK
ncbi:MAG: hypothetical protein HRT57_14250 [Crocinitomicaceae bacterium]|nr:hypothetical protein [Crocinitomicaceae bacterium]